MALSAIVTCIVKCSPKQHVCDEISGDLVGWFPIILDLWHPLDDSIYYLPVCPERISLWFVVGTRMAQVARALAHPEQSRACLTLLNSHPVFAELMGSSPRLRAA